MNKYYDYENRLCLITEDDCTCTSCKDCPLAKAKQEQQEKQQQEKS